MKRILFFLAICFCAPQVFSQTKNLILRQSYNPNEIKNININLVNEDIITKLTDSDEIIIEIGSNNKNNLPIINIEDKNLIITQKKSDYNKGDKSTVQIYFPRYYTADSYNFKTSYGNLILEDLNCFESIIIDNSKGSTYIRNPKCDYFKLTNTYESASKIQIENLSCSFFSITSIATDINLNLTKSPLATSSCTTKFGCINLKIPETEDFLISARSNKSIFSNNYAKTKKAALDWVNYSHNQGGPLIQLQTFQGDITVGE